MEPVIFLSFLASDYTDCTVSAMLVQSNREIRVIRA